MHDKEYNWCFKYENNVLCIDKKMQLASLNRMYFLEVETTFFLFESFC